MKNLIIFVMVSIIITGCGLFKPDDKIRKLSAKDYDAAIQKANDIIYDEKSLAPLWYKNALTPTVIVKTVRKDTSFYKPDEVTEIALPSFSHTPFWLSLFLYSIASLLLSIPLASLKCENNEANIIDEAGGYFIGFLLLSIPIAISFSMAIKVAYHFIYNTKGAFVPAQFCITIGFSIFALIYLIAALCLLKPIRETLARWHEDYKNM